MSDAASNLNGHQEAMIDASIEVKDTVESLDPDDLEDRKAQTEAIFEFTASIGELLAEGANWGLAVSLCEDVADKTTWNKTELKKQIKTAKQNAISQSSSRRSFDEVLEDDVVEIVKIKSTDHHQGVSYRWVFQNGTVETRQSKDDKYSHFSWNHFMDDYFDATGEMPHEPGAGRRGGDEWREFVADLIAKRATEKVTRGPRTCAVDALRNYISSTKGYAEVADAVSENGVYIDDDPEGGSPSEVWVPNPVIKRICNENELKSTRELQCELDGRGLTSDQVNGASFTENVGNRTVTVWRLDSDIATPLKYVEEVKTPAEKVRQREEDDEADSEPESDDEGSSKTGEVDSLFESGGSTGEDGKEPSFGAEEFGLEDDSAEDDEEDELCLQDAFDAFEDPEGSEDE
ncbi:hypothetical protein [Haloarchaeobius sp. DT45]|uniref:hypothetical protein n=1 Tax=Haloarchaeobius sp. DT45 TaxID=3446116 RepID=UPI003F6ADC6D